jgi:hypothetical protein
MRKWEVSELGLGSQAPPCSIPAVHFLASGISEPKHLHLKKGRRRIMMIIASNHQLGTVQRALHTALEKKP